MARRRMVPTRFFKDPDILNLGSKDTQLILIGLILTADDEGREVAHPGMLGREMDYPADQIEAALAELAANDLILLYQVGKHRYYQLTRWREWQTLGGHTTPSRYPAPPDGEPPHLESNEHASGEHLENNQGIFRKSRGKSRKFPEQFNLRESNLTEDDGQHSQPNSQSEKVLRFPTARSTPADDAAEPEKIPSPGEGADLTDLTNQVAHILRLPVTDALARLVAEYAPLASLSLLGEADAAREWIDGPKNQRAQRMTPAFFRRWLKRECQDRERQRLCWPQTALATGTAGTARSPASRPETAGGRRPPDLMHLAEEDAQAKRKE